MRKINPWPCAESMMHSGQWGWCSRILRGLLRFSLQDPPRWSLPFSGLHLLPLLWQFYVLPKHLFQICDPYASLLLALSIQLSHAAFSLEPPVSIAADRGEHGSDIWLPSLPFIILNHSTEMVSSTLVLVQIYILSLLLLFKYCFNSSRSVYHHCLFCKRGQSSVTFLAKTHQWDPHSEHAGLSLHWASCLSFWPQHHPLSFHLSHSDLSAP